MKYTMCISQTILMRFIGFWTLVYKFELDKHTNFCRLVSMNTREPLNLFAFSDIRIWEGTDTTGYYTLNTRSTKTFIYLVHEIQPLNIIGRPILNNNVNKSNLFFKIIEKLLFHLSMVLCTV